jgi:GNAT superfamily N-acetyltransferase
MIGALSEATTARVIQAWRVMSGLPDAFRTPGSTIIGIVDDALICPPGWCGYVRIGDRTVMTAPGPEQAARLSEAAFRSAPDRDRLGPAILAYLDHEAASVHPAAHVTRLTASDPMIAELERAVANEEAGEAAVSDVISPVFAITEGGLTMSSSAAPAAGAPSGGAAPGDTHPVGDGSIVVAAAGYRPWLDRLAHLSVLTRTGYRGRGLATMVAAAAISHAQAAGLTPQWRALVGNAASLAIATRLGFVVAGEQISARFGVAAAGEEISARRDEPPR